MKTTTILAAVLVTAFGATAQEAETSQQPSDAAAPAKKAPVVLSKEKPADSDLVKAAKAAKATKKKSTIVITDETIKNSGGKITEPHGKVRPVYMPPEPKREQPKVVQTSPPIERATLTNQLKALKEEQKELAVDLDEVYDGDRSQEEIAKRASELQRTIEELEKKLKEAPPEKQP